MAGERNRFVALAFCRADLLFELDDSQDIVFAAGATPFLLGRSPDDLMGSPFLGLIAESDRTLAEQMLAAASRQGRIDDVIVRLNGAKGQTPAVAISGYRVPDFDNNFFLALKVEPARVTYTAEEDLKRDEETGLLDESSYSTAAAERVLSYQRAGGKAHLTMVKVDNLETLVEKLGASDKRELLNAIGDILKAQSLGGDTAGTVDGENLSFIHGDNVDPEDVNRRIEDAARKAHPEGGEVHSRSSTLDADGAGMTQDQVAKAIIHSMQKFCAGDGNIKTESLSDAFSNLMANTVENVAYVKDVTASQEFDLAFMPICDLRLGKVHHFEALCRFRDGPAMRSPYQLINLAEEVGIIADFDLAVCKKAITLISEFTTKETIPAVAVNLSGSSLSDDEFVKRLQTLLARHRELSDLILFEITESAKIENLDAVNDVIQSFRERGFKVCLDDFGAGAASFDYLNALDVDIVKFDGPVIRRAFATAKGNDLLTAMAKMCHNMNVHTVAEMVEDKKVANHAYYCGIDFGQGWHFGKPTMDPFEFAEKFATRVVEG